MWSQPASFLDAGLISRYLANFDADLIAGTQAQSESDQQLARPMQDFLLQLDQPMGLDQPSITMTDAVPVYPLGPLTVLPHLPPVGLWPLYQEGSDSSDSSDGSDTRCSDCLSEISDSSSDLVEPAPRRRARSQPNPRHSSFRDSRPTRAESL